MNRNYGIDISKIISMMMFVVMHILLLGGVIGRTRVGTVEYFVVWCVEIICYTGVNLFAIASGYVLLDKKWKLLRFVKLWSGVFFWGVFSAIIATMAGVEGSGIKEILKACIPIVADLYWYFSCYFIVFILSPFINDFVNIIDKKKVKASIYISLIAFSFLSVFSVEDSFVVKKGYSAIWLLCCYLIGAYIRKYDIKAERKKALWFGIGNFALIFAVKVLGDFIEAVSNIEKVYLFSNALISYNSFAIMGMSLAIFSLFKQIEVKAVYWKKIIHCMVPTLLGIYIIHTNKFIWMFIKSSVQRQLDFLMSNGVVVLCLGVVFDAILIFVCCMILEKIRLWIWDKVKINYLLELLTEKIENKIRRIF